MFVFKPIYRLGRLKDVNLFSDYNRLRQVWASCLLNGASCLLNVGRVVLGRVVLGRVFFGASCLEASCLWGELS